MRFGARWIASLQTLACDARRDVGERIEDLCERAAMMDPRESEAALSRIPPHSVESEQSVLGGLLQGASAYASISDMLGPPDFYRHEHKLIFDAIATMVAAGQAVDMVTVFEHLQSLGKAENCGGLGYLNALANCVPSAANIVRYAEIVRERSVLRKLIAASDEIATAAFNPQGRASTQLIDELRRSIEQIEQQSGASRRRLPMLGMAELRETAASAKWLVKHTLPADSIGMLFGSSGTFKSFIALDAALHIVHGLPWLGRRTKQGPVIFLAAEGGSGIWKRVAAWHRSRRIHWQGAPLYVVPVALDLAQDAWRVVEAAQAAGVAPALVVVDTLSQTYAGEENSANEMAGYFREIGARFRDLWHCTVLLIHHSGHNATERPRGSSAIKANLDFLLGVHRDENEMLATLSCQKQKEGDSFPDADFQLVTHDLGTDEDGDRVTSLVARHLSSAEEVQEAMDGEKAAGRVGHNQLLLSLLQNGTREADLRKAFFDACDLSDPETRRRTYNRAKAWATKRGYAEFAQGYVITLKPGQ